MHESKLNPEAHNSFGKSMRRSFSVMGMPVLKAPPVEAVEDPVSELEAASCEISYRSRSRQHSRKGNAQSILDSK